MPRPTSASLATTIDQGHGRHEKRTLRRTTCRTKTQEWAGLPQGFERTRERTIQGPTTRETVAGITRQSVAPADAARLLELTRGPWGIDNGLHDKRDVTLGEDARRVRREAAPQVMAALRNRIVPRLDRTADRVAAVVRSMSNGLDKALTLLGLPQLE